MLQVFFNFISKAAYIIPMTMISTLISCLGIVRMIFHEEGDLYVILIEKDRLGDSLNLYLGGVIALICIQYMMQFGQNEIYKIYRDRN